MSHLLIVEDDELLRDALTAQLLQGGHTVASAAHGVAAVSQLKDTRFDGVILDLGLPPVADVLLDGMDVLRWTRQELGALPVLILTARDGVDDRVEGLNAGADDYLTKPFNMAELLARLQAMLRRSQLPAFGGSAELVAVGKQKLRIDAKLPRAWLDEVPIDLTQREWELLSLLVTQMGQVVSREDVLQAWKDDAGDTGVANSGGLGSNALEVYVHRLRRKLLDSGLSIRNVRGLGYMLEPAKA